MSSESAAVRHAAVAGMFYPGTRPELEDEVGQLLGQTPPPSGAPRITGDITALIVPHAGYMYSGATAAHAYALVRGRKFDTCILVGPSHQDYFRGVSVYPGAAYATPLGACRIDAECRHALLAATPLIEQSINGHRGEHSLEVQIPFLQTVLPETAIVPLVMGDQYAGSCRELGEAIARAVRGRNVLLIASSDLSHFFSSSVAREKDGAIIALIEAFDVSGLLNQLEAESCEACGGGPIAAVMLAAERLGAQRATIVHACNSGDVTGETSRVVGYCSAALWKPS